MGVPQNGWFIMDNPIGIDEFGLPLVQETTPGLAGFLDFSLLNIAHLLR